VCFARWRCANAGHSARQRRDACALRAGAAPTQATPHAVCGYVAASIFLPFDCLYWLCCRSIASRIVLERCMKQGRRLWLGGLLAQRAAVHCRSISHSATHWCDWLTARLAVHVGDLCELRVRAHAESVRLVLRRPGAAMVRRIPLSGTHSTLGQRRSGRHTPSTPSTEPPVRRHTIGILECSILRVRWNPQP
jgi:hypothetical protein